MSEATQHNIKRLLALTGTTHAQLGEIAGVTRSTVSHWVKGTNEPRMGAVQAMADHFRLKKSNIVDAHGMDYVERGVDGKLHDRRDEVVHAKMLGESWHGKVNGMYSDANGTTVRSVTLFMLEPDEMELVESFRTLNEAGKAMALAAISAFAKSGDYSE